MADVYAVNEPRYARGSAYRLTEGAELILNSVTFSCKNGRIYKGELLLEEPKAVDYKVPPILVCCDIPTIEPKTEPNNVQDSGEVIGLISANSQIVFKNAGGKFIQTNDRFKFQESQRIKVASSEATR